MKAAIELLGTECRDPECMDRLGIEVQDDNIPVEDRCFCIHDLEAVAQRAREEMREAAARKAEASSARLIAKDIRKLPVKL